MSTLERQARQEWLRDAIQVYAGRCDVCGRTRDNEGKILLVARQRRRRQRECLDCHGARLSGWRPLGNVNVLRRQGDG